MSRRTTWCVIVPLNSESMAKSRLRALGSRRTLLARSFARDVLSALAGSSQVDEVLVVGDGTLIADPTQDYPRAVAVPMGIADLNRAIAAAESRARSLGYDQIAVVVADLACAQPQDFDDVFTRARTAPRAFVADHRGRGTTVLTTTGPALDPAFGPHSAQRHERSGATSLDVTVRIRFDIDEPTDVTLALAYGVGAATTEVLGTPAE